jgi:hypothetical protein
VEFRPLVRRKPLNQGNQDPGLPTPPLPPIVKTTRFPFAVIVHLRCWLGSAVRSRGRRSETASNFAEQVSNEAQRRAPGPENLLQQVQVVVIQIAPACDVLLRL